VWRYTVEKGSRKETTHIVKLTPVDDPEVLTLARVGQLFSDEITIPLRRISHIHGYRFERAFLFNFFFSLQISFLFFFLSFFVV
jgi:hypothetical protein